jgi:hypothetical protein
MAAMRTAPHRQSTAVDESLRAEAAVERDQCGYCGGWFTPAPGDLSGVCRAHGGMAYNGLADSAGPLDS